jgi:hypothetical protein
MRFCNRLFVGLLVCLTPIISSAAEKDSRAEQLVNDVRSHGLLEVVRRPSLSTYDKSVLRLVAELDGDERAKQELGPQPELPQRFKASPERAIEIFGAKWLGREAYSIVFMNETDTLLEEVVIIWQKRTGEGPYLTRMKPYQPNLRHTFLAGACDEMGQYILGVYLDGELIVKIPEEGNMTPHLASKMHPDDTFPCSDSWTLTAQPQL